MLCDLKSEETSLELESDRKEMFRLLLSFSCSVVSDSLCDLVACSLPGSSVHAIFQARTLEWAASPFSRTSSSRIGRWIRHHRPSGEAFHGVFPIQGSNLRLLHRQVALSSRATREAHGRCSDTAWVMLPQLWEHVGAKLLCTVSLMELERNCVSGVGHGVGRHLSRGCLRAPPLRPSTGWAGTGSAG